MIILGIHGDIYSKERLVFESNAAIVKDGKVISAVSEERLSRLKMDGKYPFLSIPDVLEAAGMTLKDVDEVAYVRFASVYRQFKDINTFVVELKNILMEKGD